MRAAIAAGYGKGFHTILDANVVTVITAMVIFLIAVADVKGFALMLLIGTVISLLTAVVATRAMLGLLSGFTLVRQPALHGRARASRRRSGSRSTSWEARNLWFAISGAIILAGVISLGAQGLNLGIDFKGGTQLTFKTHKPYSQGEVAEVHGAARGSPTPSSRARGKAVNGDYKDWQVRTKSLDAGRSRTTSSTTLKSRPRRVRGRDEERLGDASATRSRSTRSAGSSSRCS